jgi:hypothetical protein
VKGGWLQDLSAQLPGYAGMLCYITPRHIKCQHLPKILSSLLQVEGVWLQDLSAQLPGYAGVGPCLVLQGRQPACGLLPACYLTDNPHVAIPLRQMSKVSAWFSGLFFSPSMSVLC